VIADRLQALQRSFALRWSESLFSEVASHCKDIQGRPRVDSLVPPVSKGHFAALMILATAIYLAVAALAMLGLVLICTDNVGVGHYIAGGFCIMLAILARPRPVRAPARPLDPSRYPAIHEVVRHTAHALGAPMVDTISAPPEFGASYRESGWGGERHMELGLPLLAALGHAERIALIAHELSHGANRDPLRQGFVRVALSTLVNWALVVRPLGIGSAGNGMPFGGLISLMAIPFELALLAFSELLFGLVRLFFILAMRSSQQAEFFADVLATSVAGREPMMRLLEKINYAETVDLAIQRAVLTDQEAAIGPRILSAINEMSEDVAERYRQRAREEVWQEDSTHPPTSMRIALVAGLAEQPVQTGIEQELKERFEAEVASLIEGRKRELFDDKLEAISG
jgi:heat shock protein HtpX